MIHAPSAHIERECVYRKRPRLYRNAARHYIDPSPPSSVGFADSFPTPKWGEAFWLIVCQLFSLPHRGRGTETPAFRWMRDVSDKLGLPCSVSLLLQRAYILGYVSQERFSDVGLSQFRACRGAGAGLLEICIHFSSSLRARAARLCVRPNSLSANRFARLACVLKT